MGLRDYFKGIISYFREAVSPGSNGDSGGTTVRRGGSYEDWLYSTSPALCISTAYRCIRLLSESVANLPILYKRQRGGVYETVTTGAIPYLLKVKPDINLNAFDFWRMVVVELLCSGNAYIVPVYDDYSREYWRLALCGRGTVSHDYITDIYTVNDLENAIVGTYRNQEIIHLKGMPGRNPKSGVSVLTSARISLNIAAAGDQETLKRFRTGGTVRGIITNDRSVKGFGGPQEKELRKTAIDVAERLETESIVSIPNDADFRQISMSSADMQFLESRKFTVREICRFFGVHPSFVFDDTSNNYKSAEMANVAFLSNTLNPMLRQIENELLCKLVPSSLALKRKFEFDRSNLYACDLNSRVHYISQMIGAGLLTVNEARALDGRAPVENGDKVLVSANLKGIQELTEPQPQSTDETDDKETD